MPAKLLKLAIEADTTTDTKLHPDINQYFYEFDEGDVGENDILTIPATKFVDDAGDSVVGTFTTASTDNGFYLLFINGVLQQSELYTIAGDGSQVTVGDAATIPVGAPITLIVTDFVPASDSITDIAT